MPEVLKMLHEFADALADLKSISPNRRAEVHALVDDMGPWLTRLAEGPGTETANAG